MARALVYLRNSSDRQAKAATIDAQRPACRALASRLGAISVVEYPEEGVSGAAALNERPVMRALLCDVRSGDLVLAFALDRISRSDDLIDQAAVYGALQRIGAHVETVLDGAMDPSSMVGRIMLTVRSEVAADERRKIVARTRAGKARAASLGRKPQGATPYGLRYDRSAHTWSLDESAAEIVREIYRRLVDGETTGRIAVSLLARHAPHPRSPRWSSSRVWRIATRATYRGEWTFSGQAISVPAIVDEATWQTVQAQLLASGRRGLRRTLRCYLLDEGTGRCGYCGGELRVRWGGTDGVTSYYLCPRRECGLGWRRAGSVDAEVWERIAVALRQPDLIERAMQGEREAQEDGAAGEREAAGYQRQLERLDGVEGAILARFRRGLITQSGLDRELGSIGRERAMIERSATAARESAAAARVSTQALDGLREATQAIAAAMGDATPDERREIVRALRPEIVLDRESVQISFRLHAPRPARETSMIGIVTSTCYCTGNHCDPEILSGIRVVA